MRLLARRVAALLKDGRPNGCTCPPNPHDGALPSDNRHFGAPRCPYSALERGEPFGIVSYDPPARRWWQ